MFLNKSEISVYGFCSANWQYNYVTLKVFCIQLQIFYSANTLPGMAKWCDISDHKMQNHFVQVNLLKIIQRLRTLLKLLHIILFNILSIYDNKSVLCKMLALTQKKSIEAVNKIMNVWFYLFHWMHNWV